MDKKWKLKTFGECAKLIKDTYIPNKTESLPYIGLEHIEQNSLQLIGMGNSSETISNKFRFIKDDILFGKLRPYFRKVIQPDVDGVCSTDIFVVRAKPGTEQDFLYYWMASQDFVDYSSKGSEGTKMPRAKWEFLERFTQFVPDTNEQSSIAAILKSLDQKIQNLRNMNHILEKIIQSIFKSWFIDFDGQIEFVDSELGQIPKGWKITTLQSICNVTMGQSPPGISYNEIGKGMIFYQGVTDFGDFFPNPRIYCTDPKRFAEKNEVLISVRAPVGTVNVSKEKCCIGRGLAALRLKENHGPFLLYLLKSFVWESFEGEGTIFGSINKDDLEGLKIVHFPSYLVKDFNSITQFMFYKIWENAECINTLSNLRDSLLPKLMSGEIRV